MSDIGFEDGSGNEFANLGSGPEEAEELTAKSTLILALKEVITRRALTQKQAAKLCCTDQPTLSKVLHGRKESVSSAAWRTG